MDLAGNSHRVPLGKRPLRRLAQQLLTAACLSALIAPEALAGDVSSQLGAVKAASSVNSAPNFAVIKADQQGYDQQLNRFVTGTITRDLLLIDDDGRPWICIYRVRPGRD